VVHHCARTLALPALALDLTPAIQQFKVEWEGGLGAAAPILIGLSAAVAVVFIVRRLILKA